MAGTQLSEVESRFFESGGQDVAPSLTEEQPAPQDGEGTDAALEPEAIASTVAKDAPDKDAREGRFVPLQALQEERAEKKQLRDELRQYREWQAQLTQRLQQQVPANPQREVPDPQTKPLEYINHVLGNMQASTAELQQWRQQQELDSQQRSALRQYASWATSQEREFAKSQPEYHDAYRYAAEARDKELQALGYSDPAARSGIVRSNTAEIIHNAMQQGRNPAELVWEYARARGFAPRSARTAGDAEASAKIAAGLQAAGGKLNKGGAGGEGEMSAKDLAGINDPDEFEKAWKRVFGKRR
jgi:hypothetical protein